MHWQFGGNLEPVQMICELDWKECPKAIANYVWNEIVTDVLDCLNNDGTVWRILAVLLASTMLLRIIFFRTKQFIESAVDKKMLNKVGYKVEDLELKVNILTYKMQYGSWPLPHQIQKSNFRKELQNLRLTVSNPNDRNNWIKHVLLSPRRNESYASYPKYDYRSTHRLTKLFDAKEKPLYPYLQQEGLQTERSSKSSKSSSDKSLKLNSIFKRMTCRKHREISKSDQMEMQHRNAISLPLFSIYKNGRSVNKLNKDSKRFKSKMMSGACKKFVKTLDECKRYLKELHDSNKNVGLVCSSSNVTDESSINDYCSEMQHQNRDQRKELTNLQNKESETARNIYTDDTKDLKNTDIREETNEHHLQPSNDVYPVLKLSDKRLIPSKMNITFYADMFPQQSVSNALIPETCERTKFIKTSQEALYCVKRKLESLHNVLRTYEIQNVEAKPSERLQESNNKLNTICQNVMNTIVSATTEVDKWNEGRKNRVNFAINTRKDSCEMPQTACNDSEQFESDGTVKSSSSVQSYSNTFYLHQTSNLNDVGCSIPNKSQTNAYPSIAMESNFIGDNQIIYSSCSKYEKVPERVYYAISSDSDEGENIKKEIMITNNFELISNMYTDKNQAKSFNHISDPYPVPMETDEDLTIMSPTSSHTEVSKDSESEDKSTALLLQEALKFKQALLTRVELEKICHIDNQKDYTNRESLIACDKYSYVNNNLQSKFLDIISEEQSVSSSTDKTSRTYMFYNAKQEKQLIQTSTFNHNTANLSQQYEIRNLGYLDSKNNLSSPSEYFSFSNIIQTKNESNNNQLLVSKQDNLQQNVSTKVIPDNIQLTCFNDISRKSNVKLTEINYTNYLNTSHRNINGQQISDECVHETKDFERCSSPQNNSNEFMNQSIHNMELFSENLDEPALIEENQNSSGDVTSHIINFKQCTKVTYSRNTEDNILNKNLNVINTEKCIKDKEISIHTPNLSLKRHPGACSLIKHALLTADVKKETEINTTLENEDTLYELSPTESKETSTETNPTQASLTSSINQSNDSNIPEPLSVTVLINKSLAEEKLNLNWLNVDTQFNHNRINETDVKTFSANTIIVKKYDTPTMDSYSKKETSDDYTVSAHECKINNRFEDEKRCSDIENSFANLDKEGLTNEVEYCKSYSTLLSPHSSLYFTDEASSSISKFNNNHSINVGNCLHSNLYIQNNSEGKPHYKGEDSKCIKNAESISMLNENENEKIKAVVTTNNNGRLISNENEKTNYNGPFISNNELDIKETLSNYKSGIYSRNYLSFPKNYIKNKNISETEKTKEELSVKETEAFNVEPLTLYTDSSNVNLLSSEGINATSKKKDPNSIEGLNISQHFSPSTSLREISPTETNKNKTIGRTNVTMKSKSHENYTAKSEKLKKSGILHNVRGLRSDLLYNVQSKIESNKNSPYTRVRDISTKSIHATESNVKLDRKRSRSQICFRSKELSKQIIPQSHESSYNANYIQSLENKLKLKDHLKTASSTPKTSSKSCIPILKSRLEAARRSENETRPKSPVRGPLTMTMFWKDNLCSKNDNVMEQIQVEGKSQSNNQYIEVNNYIEESGANNDYNNTMKSSNIVQNTLENVDNNTTQQEQMVIYVNIFTKQNHNTTKIVDPNKFLEYIKTKELKVEKIEESQCDVKNEIRGVTTENKNNTMNKIITIFSSVIDGNELDQTISTNVTETGCESLPSVLTSSKLKNLCFLSVEQREIDVTAKPSVIDTSTSISDLENISGTTENILNKFQIYGIPKELNNEEYITLLDILHQEPNFVHLQELQNVCKKLVSEHLKSK